MLSVDVSFKGLGAVLIQDDKPVVYGSRALTEIQKRYSQIKKLLQFRVDVLNSMIMCMDTVCWLNRTISLWKGFSRNQFYLHLQDCKDSC